MNQSVSKIEIYIGYGFVAFLFIVGLILSVPSISKSLSCKEATNGTIVGIDVQQVTDFDTHQEHTVRQPKVAYDVNGVHYEKPYGTHNNMDSYYEGQIVKIRYNKANPSIFVIDARYGLDLPAFLGLFIMVFCVGMVFKIRKMAAN